MKARTRKGEEGSGKVDRRVARSRAAIISAFERLIGEKPLRSITVRAVAHEANVDRKTVYQHFGGIDGLLQAICDELVANVAGAVEAACERYAEEAGRELSARERSQVFFTGVNRAVCKNLIMNRNLFESVPTEVLLEHIKMPLQRELVGRGLASLEVSPELVEYYLSFILGGIVSAYRTWALSDRSVAIEEVSHAVNGLVMDGVGTTLR